MDLVDVKAYLHFLSCLGFICAVVMHGSILLVTMSPPWQSPGQVQPFGPGGGELFEGVLSREVGGGANKNIFSLILRS